MTGGGTYASPPCMAAEVDPACFDPLAIDPVQARDVVRWHRAQRTRLAVLMRRPRAVGIAPSAARLPTIYPQPHDIPLDLILTEDGATATRTEI